MKRIAFAWIEEIIDFDSQSECEKFILDNRNTDIVFKSEVNVWTHNPRSERLCDYYTNDITYHNKDTATSRWTINIMRPYKQYNMGV